ncbi:hypothetical protein GRI58_03605 [Porphyrobacter algicida]|uniref:Uncharacterized protein n=1 Tax=Qipengyuania algicida TaxID=1836209 RepID=A0A845AEJ6_9SPHN|nr:hypothetical protein [Qipengyuania algicida]MXP27907.1 hypothetical protein [Qipengyuania algicida]
MASNPLGTSSRVVTLPNTIPPAPAVMRILDRFNRDELGNAIEVLVALLDIWDGEPDDEVTEAEDDFLDRPKRPWDRPGCDIADPGENAWIEWDQLRHRHRRGPNISSEDENAEDDDPAGQYDEDTYSGPRPKGFGPGCDISDPDCEHDGREHDGRGLDNV